MKKNAQIFSIDPTFLSRATSTIIVYILVAKWFQDTGFYTVFASALPFL